eukprot:c11150_g1_i1.p1 GENE.c11150_g1_i1~~c11150_g1_i1.p1  ORF type:complete len:349 (+),score=113.84 c11150_g1_i1:40-1047(+)
MLVFALTVLGAVWHGRTQHEANLAALNDLRRTISGHEHGERETVYGAAAMLNNESNNLEVVTSTADASDLSGITYDSALKHLTNTFIRNEELVGILLNPLEMRTKSLRGECDKIISEHHRKITGLQHIARFIHNITAVIDSFKHRVDVDEEQRIAFETRLNLKVQHLIELTSVITDINATVPISTQRNFIDEQRKLIAAFERNIRDQLDLERKRLAAAETRCREDSEALQSGIQNAHHQLASAETQFNEMIRSFAHIAKQDVGHRIDQLSAVAKFNAEIRDAINEIAEQTSDQSELITLSLCDDDCSYHGTCWSGVCRCDPGWVGASCAQRLEKF